MPAEEFFKLGFQYAIFEDQISSELGIMDYGIEALKIIKMSELGFTVFTGLLN